MAIYSKPKLINPFEINFSDVWRFGPTLCEAKKASVTPVYQ
ncbi:hypothetical protein ONA23_05315 [Mycoplasmopsis cynos]|nr:hypothetical protein [Mycoplasmopsis cynos]WAM06380.1 hypothetical protein ONA23_05315 [Mycoplasmopsis cynos]